MKSGEYISESIGTSDVWVSEKSGADNGFPYGIGYKSCWMVVEGTSQKEVMDAFLQGRKIKYAYKDGFEKVEKANAKEKKLLVTSTHKKQNYVVGSAISQFFYDTETFVSKCKNLPRVYVYMTNRVSETHGFAFVENGELIRLFCCDENEIQNIGDPLPDEIALGYQLPKSFEDVRDKERKFTDINEDMLVELAIHQTGIDVEKYPYKDVKVGKLFELTQDLTDDPYPESDDYPEVSEETMNLPEVQRFLNAKSYGEKHKIVQELKDVITHPLIDAIGEAVEVIPCYGRLSERYEELLCIIGSMVKYDDEYMDKEELVEGININDGIFYDKNFCVNLDEIKCKKLTFHNCSFHDMSIFNNQINRLEFYNCYFRNVVFGEMPKDKYLAMKSCFFSRCRIQDFELLKHNEQLEIIDCTFQNCSFSDMKK